MDAEKKARKARLARIVGFICVGLALLNATVAVLAMVAEKNAREGMPNIAIAGSLFVIGMVSLVRASKEKLGGPGA